VAEFMQVSIVFSSACIMSSYRKFTFSISSPDDDLLTSCCTYYSNAYLHWRYVAWSI